MKRTLQHALGLAALASTAWVTPAGATGMRSIRLTCDGGRREGAGVLIADFRPGREHGLLLLTALHVLEGCASVEPKLVSCETNLQANPGQREESLLPSPWSQDHPVEVLSWVDLDLAAVVIPDAERAVLSSRVDKRNLGLRADQQTPPRNAHIDLIAAAGLNTCPPVPALRRDLTTAYNLFKGSRQPDWRKMLGSLAGTTVLMSYQSSAERGMSGGPVIWMPSGAGRVLAIHLGGKEDLIQWGVLVGARELLDSASATAPPLRLDATHPRLTAPDFGPPSDLVDGDVPELARLDLTLNGDRLQALVEATTPVDPFGAVSVSPQLAWAHEWFSPGFALLHTAFATRILIGGAIGRYRSPIADDNGHSEEPLQGTARLPFYGVLAEIDAELHLARLATVSYAVSVGLRGGVSHQSYVADGGNSFVWGPVTGGRAAFGLTDKLGGFAQLNLAVQRIPVAACPIGCQGPAVSQDPVWDVWGGASIGVEFQPW